LYFWKTCLYLLIQILILTKKLIAMELKTKKIQTRFMEGNICDEMYYISDNLNFDFDNAIYSNGFIAAVKNGLVPDFDTLIISNKSSNNKSNQEYHHVIIGDICYIVFFN